ncbi:S8 family peptidase [Sphingobacterium bambusae]|uniref:S8 family peptidase n=1 Tax=Sphingobacterium bambusae TaxID=662858 RepID=A0ABW6BGV1_9SPHI|nr:S8 family peptidase [Sphingobacterium bambusae]WPL49498.1 S8 family peptidase [Sphingobacterium bambusae]
MPKFPHLPLRDTFKGRFKFPQTPRKPNPRTQANRENKPAHAAFLEGSSAAVKEMHYEDLDRRKQIGFPELSYDTIPVFLQVDPVGFDIESLKGFGIEVIAEEDDGFIIGASIDGFKSLRDKIKSFESEQGALNTAMLWDIVLGDKWRVGHILSDELQNKWGEISDHDCIIVNISIACYLKCPEFSGRKLDESDGRYEKRRAKWEEKESQYYIKLDELASSRQDEIERFLVDGHGAEILSGYISEEDSFGFKVQLSGIALKDFVLNYPYVFEVVEDLVIDSLPVVEMKNHSLEVDLLPPDKDAPKICIIDSGIAEGHHLLRPAILSARSRSFIPGLNTTDVADEVPNGGHGTRVAGSIVFGREVPTDGKYKAPCQILNARVLNKNNALVPELFPPELMEDVCLHYADAQVFNLSINNSVPCRTARMSQWAASLDRISNESEHIFVVSAGNIRSENTHVANPGIKNHLLAGKKYPTFLLEPSCRIADPAQSLFSITVGSVCVDEFEDEDHKSFGSKHHVSSFSRSGVGLWDSIKPELVEYGGDWVAEKKGPNLIFKSATCPQTVISKGPGVARDAVGTSFAAPKVSHILAKLIAQFPDQVSLFHKALLLQSARLPEHVGNLPTLDEVRHYGYGIPDVDRAVENSVKRITFTSSGKISSGEANLYTVTIPEELRRQGEDYEILIEVSLCYTANNRRTRRRIKSYLSSWLSWQSALLGQTFDVFKQQVLKNLTSKSEIDDPDIIDSPKSIPWVIGDRSNSGTVKGLNRQSSANQKDWALVRSYHLSSEISFAIVGHKGWEKDPEESVPYAFIVSFEVLNAEIPIYHLMSKINVQVESESEVSLSSGV